MIAKRFYPDRIVDSVWDIDYRSEFESGIRAVIFDIDNTLVPHDAPADEKAVLLFEKIREAGLQTCLISNNGEQRVKPFAEKVDSLYIFDAGKPMKKAYVRAMETLGSDVSNTLFVGDQLLTDIYGAKRMKMKNVMTRPVDPESDIPRIKFKRKIERILLRKYNSPQK